MTEEKLLEIGKYKVAAPVPPDRTPEQVAKATVIRGRKSGQIGIPRPYLFGALVNGGKYVKFEGLRRYTGAEGSLVPAFIFLPKAFYPFKNQDEPMQTSIMGVPATKGSGMVPCIRAMFENWKIDVDIRYLEDEIHEGNVRAIVERAGLTAGVGAYRPARKGFYGQFEITRWEVESEEEHAEEAPESAKFAAD